MSKKISLETNLEINFLTRN